jgi:hypothetical protein
MMKKLPMNAVPCNGCTLCCQRDAIRLEAEDRPEDYQTEPHPYLPGALMLAHKPNGECVYLDAQGCSIHGRAPSLCRVADCRAVALQVDFETARQLHLQGRLDFRVWDRGHELIEALSMKKEE